MGSSALPAARLDLTDIAAHHNDVQDGLTAFFRDEPPEFIARYAGSSLGEMKALEYARRRETELQSSLTTLAALEAAFRLDYQRRCERKLKDALSKRFRALYQKHKQRVRFEDDILQIWKEANAQDREFRILMGSLIDALKLRHWLAHGRHWDQNLGRTYDFQTVFRLAESAWEACGLPE